MKKKTIHLHTGVIVSEVTRGHTVIITKRGVPVAELCPVATKSLRQGMPDREAWLARFPEVPGDSGKFLEEDRR